MQSKNTEGRKLFYPELGLKKYKEKELLILP